MTTLKSLLASSLLALTMACGAALATPITYHVDLSTKSFSADGSGYLELSLAGPGTGVPTSAFISKLTGVGSGTTLFGDASAAANGFTLRAPDGALWQAVTFGGLLGFDLTLDLGDEGNDGSRFSLAFVNQDQTDYLTGSLLQIDLFAGAAPQIQGSDIVLITEGAGGGNTDVPEPADWALVMTGLGLLGLMRRRRA